MLRGTLDHRHELRRLQLRHRDERAAGLEQLRRHRVLVLRPQPEQRRRSRIWDQQYEFEVKDGGADGEHSELWQTFFTDDWQGWHLIQIPFSSLKLRTDFQPTGGPINGTLDLNTMRGFALTEPPGSSNGEFDVDQFALYGVNTGAINAHITTAAARLRSRRRRHRDSRDQAHDERRQAARPRRHRQLLARQRNRDRGHRLHRRERRRHLRRAAQRRARVQTFTVQTLPSSTPSEAKTIPIQLTATGADVTLDKPVVVINAHGLPYLDPTLPSRSALPT